MSKEFRNLNYESEYSNIFLIDKIIIHIIKIIYYRFLNRNINFLKSKKAAVAFVPTYYNPETGRRLSKPNRLSSSAATPHSRRKEKTALLPSFSPDTSGSVQRTPSHSRSFLLQSG
ncbi:hypothetical protein CDAR_515721 [Caerostris darwini]|uniref:Uncharacterized protein n=1 Tax=Caerostris darwini TaxID=1538125 RepID=A0AAV4S2M6_9ARAC|nr:hypothetical protein CDAR_515721 [Caerostris darwini]